MKYVESSRHIRRDSNTAVGDSDLYKSPSLPPPEFCQVIRSSERIEIAGERVLKSGCDTADIKTLISNVYAPKSDEANRSNRTSIET